MRLMRITVLIALLALAACGPQPTLMPSPQPTPTAVIPGSAAELTITFRQKGGVAGRADMFVLKPNGTVTVGTEAKRVEGGAAAAELASRLAATGIYDVAPGRYMPATASIGGPR